MDRFWDLLQRSVIVSGILALVVWGAIIYLAVVQQPVPDILYYGGITVIAFFFGNKQGADAERMRATLEKEKEG